MAHSHPEPLPAPALSILNPQPKRLPGPALLHHLVKDVSSTHLPAIDHHAADGRPSAVSYSDLHQRSGQLAARILAALPEASTDAQVVVPLLLPQSPELYISQLAVLKAGGAFCPLNLDAPPERVRFIFGDVSARVVVTSKSLRSKLDAIDTDVTVVLVDHEDERDGTAPHTEPAKDVQPRSLAYVMYTSGSTGTPKGVGISHEAATQALLAHDRHIPMFSRFLQFAAPTFDVSVFEIFFPLFRGSTLVSCNRADMLNDLPAVIRDMRVDACELTPTVAGSLLRSRQNAPGLRLLLTIGEMLTEPVIMEFGGNAERSSILWAMYGPTEATIHCTLQPACEASSSANNVGFPLDTVSSFILKPLGDATSQDFEVLPLGELGELAVGGHQTAVGYLNRPEQTAQVFIDTPYGRLYRTGDKSKMQPDGTIECFGRISDGQVKLRGQRIELGEIEQAVLRTPGTHGAVAAVVQGVIVIFCETEKAPDKAADKVLEVCQKWLPTFMVPGDIVCTKAFPRLPSGKVDRKKLKSDYEISRSEDVEDSYKFDNDEERQMAQIILEAVGAQLRSSSVLSATGVDSLTAIRLASRFRQAGFDVSAVDILRSRTLTHLRSRIQRQENSRTELSWPSQLEQPDQYAILDAASMLGVQADTIQAVVPCSPMQNSMLAETLSNKEAYCNWIELQVPATHTAEAIAAWFHELAQNNDILRTGFVALEGTFRQVVWAHLDPSSVIPVKSLTRRHQLTERGLVRPFSVQILATNSNKHTSVVLQIHHALYDGWSLDLLLYDLNILAQGGRPVKRPSFRLLTYYYNSSEFRSTLDASRSYWAENLLGFQPTPMPQLLTKLVKSVQVLSAHRKLGLDISAVQRVSAQLDISMQVLFQTCFLWLWGSILGSDDVVIGNVTSGRTVPVNDIEEVVGPCLTTIPLRVRMRQARTIKELLDSVHASNCEGLAHCTLPLTDIKKAAGIAPAQPLYDALFVYQESLTSRLEQQASAEVRQVAHQDYLETKVLLEIEPAEKSFQLRVTYHGHALHYSHVELLLRQFECVCAHMIKYTESDIITINDCFSDSLLSTYNINFKNLKSCSDLATLFERTAASHSERPAICFAQTIQDEIEDLCTISYKELNTTANRIARLLQSSGASEGMPVAIIMEKSIMLYAGILGILKAGCAYLPLLPGTPKARIHTILTQADVRLCLSDVMCEKNVPELSSCRFVSLRDTRLEHFSGTNIGTTAEPSRIANIIYTSGSTGIPKGVCVTQLNICSNLDVLSRIYPVKDASRMLQACSQAFDVSVFEILFALTQGMCLCAATNDTLFADLERSIRVLDVTHLSMTPTVASLVDPENVPKVEFLVTSGEPMTSEVARKWVGKLYQGYGPSETTNICSVKKMTSEDHIRHLGHVFENTSTFVLAPQSLDVVPIGCVGELCFGGDQVVAGYLNLPNITKQKFVDHLRFGRIYRSGDIGRMLADGSLLIIGRTDDQIKLRGQRIELGEINNVAAASSEVSNCVTMLVHLDDESTQQLACFYVPASVDIGKFHVLQADDDLAKIKESVCQTLQAKLPGYMIPSYLIPISTIPMTSSGKVDRRKLKEVFSNLNPQQLGALSSDSARDADSDWTEEERSIAAVVANVLHASVQDVGRWTPLTSLGLDSISAISVAKGLHSSFSRRVAISAILQNSSVARLAILLSRQQTENVTNDNGLDVFAADFTEKIRQRMATASLVTEEIFPCTPLQEAMLASSTDDAAYLNKMLFRLLGDVDAMKEYWSTMFQRHGILRTCFFSTDDRDHAMAQCILKTWEPEWQSYDAREISLDQVIQKHAEVVPAAIDSGVPPTSLALITKEAETYLSFVCHHAMYDGVAISRLLEEIELLASGVELPSSPRHGIFIKEMLALPDSTNCFWREHLNDFKPQALSRTNDASTGRDILTRPLNISLLAVHHGLRGLNISLLSLLQSSWGTLLRIILETDDVCFGNVVNGRNGTIDRVDELVAPCFNTIPTRVDFRDHKSNSDVLRMFQALSPDLMQYQFTPLRRIQALAGGRLFDTLLLLQQPPRPLDGDLWVLEKDAGEMDFPLVCEVTPNARQDELEVKLHFDRACVSDACAEFVYDALSHIISNVLRYPSSRSISSATLPSALKSRLDGLGLVRASNTSPETVQGGQGNGTWSKTEAIIRGVFSRMSKVSEDKISRHTTIFKLGLDSINAVQVAAMLREEEGFSRVTATDVLENSTCSKLASKLAKSDKSEENIALYDLAAFQRTARSLLEDSVADWDSVEEVFPCTALQMGMLMEFIHSKGNDYMNFISFQVDPGITTAALEAAWVALVEGRPILRVGFAPLDHNDASFAMVQTYFRKDQVPVRIQNDGPGFDAVAWQLEARRAVLNDLRRPPWQVRLVHDGASVKMHLAIHHVIYDASSLQGLMDGLAKILRDETVHSGVDIGTTVQDIITQTCRSRKTAEAFWKTQAAKVVVNRFPTMTPLREDKRETLVKTRSSTMSLTTLEEATRNACLTIQAVAQAAWSRILSSYLGEPSVVFGTIFSGRSSEATRDALFPCITILPIIAQNSGSNRELLQTMFKYSTDLQRHQRTSLTEIQRSLGLPNTKLFDTLLVYQKFERGAECQNPWKIVDEKATVDYPVSIEIEPQENIVELRITFFSDVLPAEQADMLLRQFDAVLCDLAQHPDGTDEALLASHQNLFAVIPAEEPELSSQIMFLHEFVEVSAQQQPDKTALEFVSDFKGDQPVSRTWTYKELDGKGNAVANILSEYVSPGDIVAVCFDKCPEAHFAMLGILKAGCSLLALDPGAPASRKEFILQDSGAVALLTDRARKDDMGFQVSVPVVVVDEKTMLRASEAPPQLARPLTPEDRSYCLYTSGTTGTPKGCEITHENAVQAMLAFQELFDGHWDTESKWLQFASYHFDVSVLEQYWTWSIGITLVAAPKDLILEDIPGMILRLDITHIDLTPSLARLVHPGDVPSLCRGVFITGGEQLKQEILDVWGPKGVIWNFYGPTEATIGVTTFPCVPINGRSSNIGRQFANVGSYVLRPGTEIPVLRGGVGELCVSGKLVGKGYLNRGELTAERFPTLQSFGERVYRTGDLVRVLHDGCFDFLGRADDQVKLRGQRLEIGEINQCIRDGVDNIIDVVTLVIRNDKQQKDLLVSFVVTARDRKAKELLVVGGDEGVSVGHKVQRACRERLPGYMVPTYVLLLPFIPLSPNNKAEIKELRALFDGLLPEQLVSPSAPANSKLGVAGRKVCQALAAMSGTAEEDIMASTNVFELGVDSITVLRFVRALKTAGIKGASAAVVLRNTTVADLAHALQISQKSDTLSGVLEAKQAVEACQHRHRGLVCRTLGVTSDQIEYIAPCSALQQGMISRSRSDGNEGAYFNTFQYELAEGLDLDMLKSAWEGLMREHSVLRTRFVSTTEGFVQVALRDTDLAWDTMTARDGDDVDVLLDDRRKAWVERNSHAIEQPLELVLLNGGEKRRLVAHIFHAIYDANSFDLMIDEVVRRYQDEKVVGAAPSFVDALLYGPLRNHSASKGFWVEQLRGARLAAMSSLSEQPSKHDLSVSRRLSFDALDKVRKTLGATQQAVIQALWSTVLQRRLNTDVTFGMIVSGRSLELEDVDKTIGPLFNTIPYHHRVTQRQTWADAVRQCHHFNTAILDFQHVPLRNVQKWCSGGRPLFDTLFSFQGAASVEAGHKLWKEVEAGINPDYPLAFEATLLPDGGLRMLVVAQKGVADEAVLERMLDEFERAAGSLADDPSGLVGWVGADGIIPGTIEEDDARLPEISDNVAVDTPDWTPEAKVIRRELSLLAGVDEASITTSTSLLELGLDSIDTIKLSARLRRDGIVLSNSELIKGQSIAQLVVKLQEKHAGKGKVQDSGYASDVEEPTMSLQQHLAETGHDLASVEQILQPTPLQDAMVSEMLQSDFQRYFNHDVLEVAPDVDFERLKQAWMMVVQHSPILRTTFLEVAGSDFDFAHAQVVKNQTLSFEEEDIQSLDDVSSILDKARAKALQGQGRSDLLQITLARSKQKTYVALSIAHALYDGWSLGLLHQDVESAYRGTYTPREGYSGYLGDILRASGSVGESFWSDYMSDAAPTLFPARNDGSISSVNRAEVRLRIPASALRAFCKRHAISQQAVTQACWAAVLATHCQRLDVTFGVVLSGRETEASEALLFPTMNTVPVRAVFHGSVSSFLQYVQENVSSVSQYQHFPLRKIQALVKNGRGQLFDTLFILQKGSDASGGSDSDVKLMTSVEGASSVEYPVCVEMETQGDSIIWRTACDNRCLSADATDALLRELESVLSFLVNSSDESVLAFGEDAVSVCGLPAFQPRNKQLLNQDRDVDMTDDANEQWSATEAIMRDALAEFSGVEPVSITKSHSIYHLGLDSISAIKVSSALRKRGIAVSVRDLIQSVSITEMAAKAATSSPPSSGIPDDIKLSNLMASALQGVDLARLLQSGGVHVADIVETLPATAMQTHMLSAWQNTNGEVFFPEFRYRLSGVSERKVVDEAWSSLVEQSPILRTMFLTTGSKVVPFLQLVLQGGAATLNPFVKLSLQQDGPNSWLVKLRIHHALYDGVSLPLLMDRFGRLLRGDIVKDEHKDLSLAWRQLVASPFSQSTRESRQAFWQDYLKDVRSSRFGMQGAADAQGIESRASLFQRAALPDTAHLKALCSQHGISIQAVFLAAYAKVLASQPGQQDGEDKSVVIGVYLANRGADTEELLYPTLALIPLRVAIPRDFRLVDVAARIQHDLHLVSEAENVGIGLWEILEWTGVVIDSFVNFLSLPRSEEDAETGDVRLREIAFGEGSAEAEQSAVLNPSQLQWVDKNAVRDAYPDAVDIEAALKPDGALDVGVFGSGAKLGDTGAQALIQGIVDVLSI